MFGVLYRDFKCLKNQKKEILGSVLLPVGLLFLYQFHSKILFTIPMKVVLPALILILPVISALSFLSYQQISDKKDGMLEKYFLVFSTPIPFLLTKLIKVVVIGSLTAGVTLAEYVFLLHNNLYGVHIENYWQFVLVSLFLTILCTILSTILSILLKNEQSILFSIMFATVFIVGTLCKLVNPFLHFYLFSVVLLLLILILFMMSTFYIQWRYRANV